MLEIRDLVVGYRATQVLRGISLDVRAGEIVAVLGANGVGKTTLNRAISGLIPITSGRIAFEGTSIEGMSPDGVVAARADPRS